MKRRDELLSYIEKKFNGKHEEFLKEQGYSAPRMTQLRETGVTERTAKKIEARAGEIVFPSMHKKEKESMTKILGCAKLGDMDNHFVPIEYAGDGFLQHQSADLNAYALMCFGDSMTPRIKHGEYVVIEPNHTITPGDEVLVVDKKGSVMIRTWMYTRDGMAYFLSVNEAVKSFGIPVEDIERMQFVSAIVKSAKKID